MSIVIEPRILDAPAKARTISRATKDKKKKEAAAIDMLVEMWERHKLYKEAGDKKALERLADEYEAIGCPGKASQIRYAENL